ncbi:hypothetical protein [Streptomyces caatingaensis]|uniref:Uncharacterized protein n=1 Tax=Streptomyces caatingaensis TaxID=1678637 RepID=A0A0K9XIV5_9ACTN|nr:hypothetical protein [Streptomyces caatingaensis]KNB53324.1 hypothetical protein AC230_01085 [Streptomyces caatingaensis]
MAAACCAVLLTTGAVACGPGEKSAAEKLDKAFDRLGEEKSVALDIAPDASADTIYTALKDSGKKGKKDDDFGRDDAEILAGLKLSYGISSTVPLKTKDKKKGDVALSVKVAKKDDGAALFELRSVDKKTFLRADLKAVVGMKKATNAKEREKKREVEEMLRRADGLPPALGAFRDVIKGEWVVLDAKDVEEFRKKAEEKNGGGKKELDKKTEKQVSDALRKALTENSRIKETGSRNGADHIEVTVSARKAAKDLKEAVKPIESQLSAAGRSKKLPDPDEVPDQDVVFDVALKDGRLSAIGFDMSRMDKDVHGKLPVSLNFGRTPEPVTAPSGAKELKLQDVMGAMMGLAAEKSGGKNRSV